MSFRQPLVVALEGGVCAGKSTVSMALQGADFAARTAEYMDLIPESEHESLSMLPPVQRASSFLRVDEERLPRGDRRDILVLDRCALTVFAFEYACYRTGRNPLQPEIADLLDRFTIARPNLILYLDVSDRERVRRHSLRPTPVLPILLDPTFNRFLEKFFASAARFFEVHTVRTTKRPIPEIIARCKTLILSANPSPPSVTTWRGFLRSMF